MGTESENCVYVIILGGADAINISLGPVLVPNHGSFYFI